MDFNRPLGVVSPTLDGDVLSVLAAADEEFSGRSIQRMLGHSSEPGVRKAAERLVEQGVVLRRRSGQAKLYRLNRRHLAAPCIEMLAALKVELVVRLRAALASWREPPVVALLFGSVARGEAGPDSDLDLFLVRRADLEADSEVWVEQLAALERDATGWTGNDARIVEFGEDEIARGDFEGLVGEALDSGIDLYGSRRRFRKSVEARR